MVDTGKDPLEVRHNELRLFLARWREDHSPNGAAFMFRHLKAFYRWAIHEALISADPTDGIRLKLEPLPMTTATDEDIAAMLAFKGRKRIDVRDRALLHLLVCTGARRSEIGSLRQIDLQLDDCLVIIRTSTTIARYVPITDEVTMHLR